MNSRWKPIATYNLCFSPKFEFHPNLDKQACTNYKLLTESWRRINGLGNQSKNNCDAPSRPGAKYIKPGDWYRFAGAAGTHLPTERLDSNAGARDVCGKKFEINHFQEC